MKSLSALNSLAEQNRGAADFIQICRFYAASRGDAVVAERMAYADEAAGRVRLGLQALNKSAVSAGSTTDSSNAAPIAGLQQSSGAFVESLRNTNVFDSVLPAMRRAPLHEKFAVSTIGATGAQINEGAARTISNLSLESHSLLEHKCLAAVVASQELLRLGGADTAAMLDLELRLALAAVIDQSFLGYVTSGLSPIASVGSTMTAAKQDFMAGLNALRLSANSRVYCILEPGTCKSLAMNGQESGAASFEGLGILGGTVADMTFLVSDSLTSGQMILLDASQLVGNAGGVEVSVIRQGAIQMQDSPDSPTTQNTVLTSTWQRGLVCLGVQRYFGCERVRSTAAAVIGGVHYLGDSP